MTFRLIENISKFPALVSTGKIKWRIILTIINAALIDNRHCENRQEKSELLCIPRLLLLYYTPINTFIAQKCRESR